MRDDFFTATINDDRVARALGADHNGSTRIIVGGAYRSHVPAVRAIRQLAPSLNLVTAIKSVGKTATARPAGITAKGILHVKLDTPDAFFIPASLLNLHFTDEPKAAIYR